MGERIGIVRGQSFELDAPLAKFYENEQKSIFAQASYDLTEKWTVGLGARYLEDDITDFDIAADGFLIRGTAPGPTTPEPPQKGHVSQLNPSAYLRFEPSDSTTLYAQAAKGFRSGVVNPLIADNCLEQAESLGAKDFTDADTLWNYELGVKSTLLDNRLRASVAAFYIDWKDVPEAAPAFLCALAMPFTWSISNGIGYSGLPGSTMRWRPFTWNGYSSVGTNSTTSAFGTATSLQATSKRFCSTRARWKGPSSRDAC